jgi:NitT/TauT family transport system permease protein
MKTLLLRGTLVVGGVFAWEALSYGVLNPALSGRPSHIAAEIGTLFASGEVWPHLAMTAEEFALGLGLGLLVGTSLGLLFAYARGIDRTLIPFVNGLNALPHLALAPLLVSWLGIGLAPKVAVSALMATFPIFYNVYQGARSVPGEWTDALRVMGARSGQILRLVVWPALLPWLLSGLRVSAGLALVGAVIGEFIGSTGGLGYLMLFAQGFLQMDRALALLLFLALWGIALDAGLRWLTRATQPWAVSSTGRIGYAASPR